MSRCFPFPPPGYEKKPIIDDPDLLKKEKRREKKHKKDKKDKEKKDGKEKREKDKCEKKHKEKKDEHRDKKKDKEKSETNTLDETDIYGQSKGYNAETLHKNSADGKKPSMQFPRQNGDLLRNKIKVGDTENYKFVQELDSRIRDEEKGMGSLQFVVEGRKNNVNKFEMQKTDGRQVVTDVAGFSANVAIPNRINGATTPPLDIRRIEKVQEKASAMAGLSANVAVPNRINGATTPPLDIRRIEKVQEKGTDVAGFSANLAVPNRINGATTPPLDIRRIEKVQEKGSDDKRGDKRKIENWDKQKQGKDKEMEKEKLKEKSEQKKAERAKNKHIIRSDLVPVASNSSTHPLDNGFLVVGNEENLKKRKDMETNGISHENELRPNKMARPISNISPENGRKDFSRSPGPTLLDRQGASHGALQNSLKVGSKGEQRVNGMIASHPVSISAKKPPIPASKPSPIKSPPVITNHVATQSPPVSMTKSQHNHIAAQLSTSKPPPSIPTPITAHHQPISRPKPPPAVVNKMTPPPLPIPQKKPPHPDTRYLNQILSVPKPDQWCSFVDQDWLFSSKAGPTSKKPPTNDPEVQVWSEAKHIESVDVCALPYVVPY